MLDCFFPPLLTIHNFSNFLTSIKVCTLNFIVGKKGKKSILSRANGNQGKWKNKISILSLFEKIKIKCFLYTIQKRKKIKQTVVMYDTKNTIHNLFFLFTLAAEFTKQFYIRNSCLIFTYITSTSLSNLYCHK